MSLLLIGATCRAAMHSPRVVDAYMQKFLEAKLVYICFCQLGNYNMIVP